MHAFVAPLQRWHVNIHYTNCFILVFSLSDDEEFVTGPSASPYQAYRAATTPTNTNNTTKSTPTTAPGYSSTTSYQVTPPMDSMAPGYATNYPTNPNYSQYSSPRRAHSPRHPSFATLRATTAASIGQYNPQRLSSNTSSSYTSVGADYGAQRHYRPPTPRNAEFRASMNNNSSQYNVYQPYYTNHHNNDNYTAASIPAPESRDVALYADLLGETGREGYTIQPPADTDRETDWSHVHSSSYDSSHMVPTTQHIPTQPTTTLHTMNNNPTTISSAIANNRSMRPVKTVNWADLNSSSSSGSVMDSPDLSDTSDNIHRTQSEEWEQVGDDHSASSISNSSTQSNASAPHTTTSVYDILQQAAAMSRDSTTSTLTTDTDRELSPWTDPTYLDLHLLGDSTDENDPYSMHDRGNIRALLGINTDSHTTGGWPMDWAVSGYNAGTTNTFDDLLQLQVIHVFFPCNSCINTSNLFIPCNINHIMYHRHLRRIWTTCWMTWD